MQWLTLFTLLLFSAPSARALEGRVVDPSGAPVRHAEVSVLGHAGSTPTNHDGRFVWTPDPALPFEILVILPGGRYMAPVLVQALPEEGPLLVVVEPFVRESVTVSSGAAPNIEAPPGSGLTVVPRKDIQERHPVRLTDVVEKIPGAGTLSDLHASVPSLRGLARGRTLLLIDGARVTTERRAGPSATYLDPFFLEGVEVSRGPGAVAYGSDAFGGVIHARTRQVEPGGPTRVRARGALGLGLPEANVGVAIDHGFDHGGLVFNARWRDFDAYRSPEGDVFNSQASDRGVLGRFGYELGSGLLSVGWQTDLGRDIGRPDDRGEAVRTAYPEEDSHRLTIAYDLDPRGGFTKIGFHGFWGRYRLLTERETEPGVSEPRSLSRSDVAANDFSLRARAVRPFGRARWEVGADVNGRYGLETLSTFATLDEGGATLREMEELSIDNARRLDRAIYTSGELLLGSRASVSGGLRVGRITTRSDGGAFAEQETAHNAVSGFGALKLEIARGLSLTGQLSRGFRDPTLSDRYFRGISGRGFVTGNPDLQPERAHQFDAALRSVRGGFRWALYGYFYRFSDLIERFETDPDAFFFRNRGRAEIKGVELEIQSEWGNGVALELGAQIARGRTLDDDAPLDDVPGESVKLELRKSFGDRVYGQIRGSLFAGDDRPGPTELEVKAYATLDLGAGVRLSRSLELRLLVRNVLDEAYPVSPDRRAVLAPGVNGVVTVVAEF